MNFKHFKASISDVQIEGYTDTLNLEWTEDKHVFHIYYVVFQNAHITEDRVYNLQKPAEKKQNCAITYNWSEVKNSICIKKIDT